MAKHHQQQHPRRPSTALPVIIAGAGPCGLVAAATLQHYSIPFVILERATRDRICSNAGSGFDLAPTAMDILGGRLNITGFASMMKTYDGLFIEDMNGKQVRNIDLSNNQKKERTFASVNRAELQNLLLDHVFPSKTTEERILLCGREIVSYETQSSDCVMVTLSDGTTMQGSVLLGCDGIGSKIRKCMMETKKLDDPLNFCNSIAFWGKCAKGKEGSKLETALRATQMHAGAGGTSAVCTLGTVRSPGSFFGIPINDTVVWALFVKASQAPEMGSDLTRRGGSVLTEDEKKKLLETLSENSICRMCMESTEASAITRAALNDRKNLNLPYSDGHSVVLLGDAAHPQTPYMGQGANMAIVDAYVICARLAKQSIPEAIQAFDTKTRRNGVKGVVQEARTLAGWSVSSNWFTIWAMRVALKIMPAVSLASMVVSGDKANMDFIAVADRDLAGL